MDRVDRSAQIALDDLLLGVVESCVHLRQRSEHRDEIAEDLFAGGVGEHDLGAAAIGGMRDSADVAAGFEPVDDARRRR